MKAKGSVDQTILKRLSFIKYLYELGIEQSQKQFETAPKYMSLHRHIFIRTVDQFIVPFLSEKIHIWFLLS